MGKLLKLLISNAKFLIRLIAIVVFASIVFCFLFHSSHQTQIPPARAQGTALESLNELEARKARKSTNAFYSGASAGNNYVFQPQGVIYKDTAYNHEVFILTQTKGADAQGIATEYGWQPWSADGQRMAIPLNIPPLSYTVQYGYPWFVLRSDGTYLRPFAEGPARSNTYQPYFDWSTAEPNTAYQIGRNYNSRTGLDPNALYKVTVSDVSGSYSLHVDLIPANTSITAFNGMKQSISGDGSVMVVSQGGGMEEEPFHIVQLTGTPAVKLSYNMPALDTYWGEVPSAGLGDLHDEGFGGNAAQGYWFWFMHAGSNADHWRIRPWGTDNGTPTLTIDNSAPFNWYSGTEAQKEMQYFMNDHNAGNLPFSSSMYSSIWVNFHQTHDIYGTKMAACTVNNQVGFGTYDLNHLDCAGTGCALYNWNFGGYGGCSYSFWPGFTDYAAAAIDTSLSAPHADKMAIKKWNATTGTVLADMHVTNVGDFIHPGQSPDGTKLIARSDWLQPSASLADLLVTVAYFPYPPEITSVSAAAGQVSVRFDWRTDQANPRTYSTRGWPNEDSSNPPPPRETKSFRLWRSSDKNNWTAVGTVNADIFSRYNFSNGAWLGNNFWTITDNPGDGTWYYAVTSLEWSGLESRTLSNIYQITVSFGAGNGLQNAAYPVSPGDLDNISTSDFNTQAPNAPSAFAYTHKKSPATANGQYTIEWTEPVNNTLIRYYNIYAQDGSDPSAIAQDVIASIPKAWCSGACLWVDWLGNTDGSTHYGITAVDYQGNESQIVYPGQTPVPVYLLPDLNQDKKIDSSDFDLFKARWGTNQGDFNSDSKTDTKDFGIMMSVWTQN